MHACYLAIWKLCQERQKQILKVRQGKSGGKEEDKEMGLAFFLLQYYKPLDTVV